jgi:CO/xanthine dehydrogenase Mo-binding subunit
MLKKMKDRVEKISDPLERMDAPEKTGGYANFTADMKLEGMLYARTLRSTRPRARILSIDFPQIPEGCFIVDRRDITGKNRVKMLVDDQPFFAEEVVNYVGEPILLVVGPQKREIERLISEISVHYRDIKPVLTIEEAERGLSQPIYGEDNCFASYQILRGDPESAFKDAAFTFEDTYGTGYQEHIYLEPQGMIGVYENQRITVYGSLQCPFYVKNALIQGLGWSQDRIRVVQMTTGGAFGGKEDYPSILAGHVAFAAIKTGRPVQLILDRNEDIEATTKRHPSITTIKTAIDKQKKIIAMDVEIKLDGGAYAGLTDVVLQRAMFSATGVYRVPNIRVRGRALATNTTPNGAFRGFGSPQAFFAIEMHMLSLADKIGEDPLDFRKRHILEKNDFTVTGGILREDVKLDDMIELLTDMSDYRKKYKAYTSGKNQVYRGVGFSLFYHGCAFTGSGEKEKIKAEVRLKKKRDGKVEILVSNVEMGQGPTTTLRKIVAQTLGIPVTEVLYDNPDTDRVPDSGPTVASRTVMIVGFLLKKAAQRLKDGCVKASEVEVEEVYKQPEYVRWDQKKFDGDAYPVYSWGANVVEVEVDPLTYEIEVKGIWGVYDIGTAIDEQVIRGQIEGGIIQGLGYATVEVMKREDGRLLQGSMTDYIVPCPMDFPPIKSALVDNYYEYGPFGAKCAGEVPFIGAAPALASAVQNALNVTIDRVPVTPEYLLEVMDSED